MNKGLILTILILSILVAGCAEKPVTTRRAPEPLQITEVRSDINDLMELLDADQTADYEANYRHSGCSSGGHCWDDKYTLVVEGNAIIEGPADGLTAEKVKEEIKEEITSMDQEKKDKIFKVVLSNGKTCFSVVSINTCFDQDDNIVYYLAGAYGGPRNWAIPSRFSDADYTEANDLIEKKRIMLLKSKKIAECTDAACKNFFTLLNHSSEAAYDIKYHHILKDVNSKFDIDDKEEFTINPGESNLKDEDAIKAILAKIRVTCEFTEEKKDSLTCFNLVKVPGTYTCELYPFISGRAGKECSYCFSAEGYLHSVECTGDDRYLEETDDFRRYYLWTKV